MRDGERPSRRTRAEIPPKATFYRSRHIPAAR
nr:MAG TPA: hypothetical protein [Caudoviricetes sp.]